MSLSRFLASGKKSDQSCGVCGVSIRSVATFTAFDCFDAFHGLHKLFGEALALLQGLAQPHEGTSSGLWWRFRMLTGACLESRSSKLFTFARHGARPAWQHTSTRQYFHQTEPSLQSAFKLLPSRDQITNREAELQRVISVQSSEQLLSRPPG